MRNFLGYSTNAVRESWISGVFTKSSLEQPASVPTTNSSVPYLMLQKIPSQNLSVTCSFFLLPFALTPNRSFSSRITASRNARIVASLSDLTINSRCPSLFNALSSSPLHRAGMLQIHDALLGFHHQHNGVAHQRSHRRPSMFVRQRRNPVVHACHKDTVLFSLSFVGVRPPCATNTRTRPIPIWIMTACLVCCCLMIRWLQWLTFVRGLDGFPLRHRHRGFYIMVSSPSVSIDGSNDLALGRTGQYPATQKGVSSVVNSRSV